MRKILYITFLFISPLLWKGAGGEASAQKQGQALIDSVLQQLKVAKEDTTKVNLLVDISFVYAEIDYSLGKKYGLQALKLTEKLKFEQGIAYAYNAIGANYMVETDYKNALLYYKKSLTVSEKNNLKKSIAVAFSNIAAILFYMNEFDSAIVYCEKALKIHIKSNAKENIAVCYINLGSDYKAKNNFQKAIDYYFKALKISEEIGVKSRISNCLNLIGNEYLTINENRKALSYLKRALKIYYELGYKNELGNLLNNIGMCYHNTNDYNMAKDYYSRARIEYEKSGNKSGEALELNNLASMNIALNNFSMAWQLYQKAIALNKEINNKYNLQYNYIGIADIYNNAPDSALLNLKIKPATRYHKALEYEKLALRIADKLNNNNAKKTALDYMHTSSKKVKNFEQALYAFEKYIALRDSNSNEENKTKISQKETELEYEKKEAVAEAEQEKKDVVQRNIRNSFIAGIIFMIIISLLLYSRFRIKQKSNLELSTAYRVLQTTQEQLVKSEKRAAFGEVATRMSHEIQNPLNFVNNFSKLSEEILEEISSAKTEEEKNESIAILKSNLQKIQHHGKRADEIVKELQKKSNQGTAYEFFEEEK